MAIPSFARRVTARESVVVTRVTTRDQRVRHRHATTRESVVIMLWPENLSVSSFLRLSRLIYNSVVIALQPRESVCFIGRTSKSRSRAQDILFLCETASRMLSFVMYINDLYIIFRKFIFIRPVRIIALHHKKRTNDFWWQRSCFPLFAQKMYLSTWPC